MVHFFIPELTQSTRKLVEELRYQDSRNTKLWMPRAILQNDQRMKHASSINIVENNSTFDYSLQCFLWDSACEMADKQDPIYGNLISCSRLVQSGNWVIITDNTNTDKIRFLFLDSKHKDEYPDEWYRFQCIRTLTELQDVFKAHNIQPRNLLLDTRRFAPYRKKFKHTKNPNVYRELKTGRIYYLDTLHRNHFEVFDPSGQDYLGEADLYSGELIPGTEKSDNKLPIL